MPAKRTAARAKPPASPYVNVPVKRRTYARLQGYRMLSQTYDEALNRLMDSVPLEMVSKEVLAEHDRRMATFEGVPYRSIREQLLADVPVRGGVRKSRSKASR